MVGMAPNNALHRTGLALRARPSLASLGAGERGRYARKILVRALLLFLIPLTVLAQGIPVKESLAQLIEVAAKTTGLSFNVPPDHMTETSINISTIEGVSVCDPSAKKNVINLQRAFAQDSSLRQTISIYGVYSRSRDGELKFLPGDSPEIKKLIGECKYLYVSVW